MGISSSGAVVVRESGKEGRIAVFADSASFEIQTGEDVTSPTRDRGGGDASWADPERRIPTRVAITFPAGIEPPGR